MEDEIDLRPYVGALLHYWWIIVLTALITGALAFAYASAKRTSFIATTIVAFLEPTQSVQFDSRFEAVPSKTTLLKSLPSLSMSDEIMAALLAELDTSDFSTVTDLEKHLSAESGTDLNLLYLRANSQSPEVAAELVNQWAELFVNTANDIYASRGSGQLEFYNQQVEEAGARLDVAEQALVEFQAVSRLALVKNELASLTKLQSDYVDYANSLTKLQDDIRAVRAQQTGLPGGVSGVAGDYTALALQSRVIQLRETLPLTIQLAPLAESADGAQNQVVYLDSLDAIVAEMQPAVTEQLAELEPRILTLQREQVALTARDTRLTTDRDLALETYRTLSRKLDEERLTSGDVTVGFRQVSRAAIPELPVSTNRTLALLAGAAFGAILSSLAIILSTWWRKE